MMYDGMKMESKLILIMVSFQAQATEIATLNGTIKRLEEDNAELRDLCCFLDDDR